MKTAKVYVISNKEEMNNVWRKIRKFNKNEMVREHKLFSLDSKEAFSIYIKYRRIWINKKCEAYLGNEKNMVSNFRKYSMVEALKNNNIKDFFKCLDDYIVTDNDVCTRRNTTGKFDTYSHSSFMVDGKETPFITVSELEDTPEYYYFSDMNKWIAASNQNTNKLFASINKDSIVQAIYITY